MQAALEISIFLSIFKTLSSEVLFKKKIIGKSSVNVIYNRYETILVDGGLGSFEISF